MPLKFVCSGKMGDFIHALYAVKNLCEASGAKADIGLVQGGGESAWRYGVEKAYDDCRDIVLAQPYVESFQAGKVVGDAIDLSRWRGSPNYSKCWSQILSEAYGFPAPSRSKWMETKDAFHGSLGKILIHKSLSRTNPEFPWAKILASIPEEVLFITSDIEEWNQFAFKTDKTRLLLAPTISEMALAISSSKFFVGNQSCPFAIASAFDVPRLAELDHFLGMFYGEEFRYSANISWFLKRDMMYVSHALPVETRNALQLK